MTTHEHSHPTGGHHDWHSQEYVDHWIDHDVTRDGERRPVLRDMMQQAPFPADAAVEVLDIGAGYGIVSEEALKAFPNARVTLLDYSAPMLERARQRLTAYADRTAFVTADLSRRRRGRRAWCTALTLRYPAWRSTTSRTSGTSRTCTRRPSACCGPVAHSSTMTS